MRLLVVNIFLISCCFVVLKSFWDFWLSVIVFFLLIPNIKFISSFRLLSSLELKSLNIPIKMLAMSVSILFLLFNVFAIWSSCVLTLFPTRNFWNILLENNNDVHKCIACSVAVFLSQVVISIFEYLRYLSIWGGI